MKRRAIIVAAALGLAVSVLDLASRREQYCDRADSLRRRAPSRRQHSLSAFLRDTDSSLKSLATG